MLPSAGRGTLWPKVVAQLVLGALLALAEGGYWDEPPSTTCLDPQNVEGDRERAARESDFAIWGHVQAVETRDTFLRVTMTMQYHRGFWHFGSPQTCCRGRDWTFSFRRSAASKALGCLVPEDRSLGTGTNIGFFFKAYHNYTVFLPSSLPVKRQLLDQLGEGSGIN